MGIGNPQLDTVSTAFMEVKFYAETLLPTQYGAFRCLVFRESCGLEHLALLKDPLKEPVLCRLHSECLTGEVFGSLKCDCRQQLESAMQEIQQQGGVLLYLRQEGRGIGLGNKIRAYALQEQGLDTVEANEALHLPIDARDYALAVQILQYLGVYSVELLTNNPLKLKALQNAGVKAKRRRFEVPTLSQEASRYVLVKQRRL